MLYDAGLSYAGLVNKKLDYSMSHLEDLLAQYYEWQGYILRRNVKVGRLRHGGWQGELDLVAYHPKTGHLVHLEPSLDALPWRKREERFAKKFRSGREFIFSEVFPWLEPTTKLEQVAVLVNRGNARKTIGWGYRCHCRRSRGPNQRGRDQLGKMARAAIPEQFGHLRMIQLVVSGYNCASTLVLGRASTMAGP